MLYREPKVLKPRSDRAVRICATAVSVLYREPKVLKPRWLHARMNARLVSVLYREPKVLKRANCERKTYTVVSCFSALP